LADPNISIENTTKHCPECNAELNIKSEICPKCGLILSSKTAVPSSNTLSSPTSPRPVDDIPL